MERPADLLLRPVHDLLRRTFFLVGWLVVGTAFAAVLMASFYRRQLLSSLRTEREQIFNEKILANMPVGIALVDPAGERFLHVNSTFVEVVRSLGHLPREADVSTATFADVAWPPARRWRACCISACPSRPSNNAPPPPPARRVSSPPTSCASRTTSSAPSACSA